MLFVVIPVFNRKQYTRDCLLSLRNQIFTAFRTVVVDDGSTDGTAEMLAKEFPEVTRLEGDGNLFWTAATNLGIRHALEQGADYVMTLNNDTIVTPEFLEQMMKWSEQKPEALLGALALDSETGKPIFGGSIINWKTDMATVLLRVLPDEAQVGLHRVSHFPGRGLLISRKVFEKIGLFDEKNFPHYYADYDFTHRATRKGFEVYCNYDAKLFTYPEASGDKENRRSRNLKNFYNHLFGIRGGGNLVNFTRFTFRNCPPIYLPSFLLMGYTRRIVGYFLK
jgi:GT2 family glycosyltransferase